MRPSKHRRRRPGRRPPDRLAPRYRDARPHGVTPPVLGPLYRVMLPHLQGRLKWAHFNRVSLHLVTGFALGGAALGYARLGVPGALAGLAAGLVAGSALAERGRFFRA